MNNGHCHVLVLMITRNPLKNDNFSELGKMRKTHNISGFTLIELMIVVAIIGILATVAMPAYINHIYRVRESGGVERLLDLQVAQEKFHALNDIYAADPTDANFQPLLSFDPDDATLYQFSIPASDANGFTAVVRADLNQDGAFTNCWRVTASPAAPALDLATAGCTNTEGFSLSLITGLL